MLESFVLIADPKGKAWGQAEKISSDLNIRLIETKIKKFRDGEEKVIIEDVEGKKCFFFHDSSKDPENWFFELICTLHGLKQYGAEKICVILPYLRYSRQDRKDERGAVITAKVIAESISNYANKVITFDLHSQQIEGFYSIPIKNIYSAPIVVEYLKKNYPSILEGLTLVGPDLGSEKFLKIFSEEFSKLGIKTEKVICSKTRPKEGEVSKIEVYGEIEEKILIIDDIIDSGNTIIKCVESLRKKGAKEIYAYATHGVFSEGHKKFEKNLKKIFVTDSIPQKKRGIVEIISITESIKKIIKEEMN